MLSLPQSFDALRRHRSITYFTVNGTAEAPYAALPLLREADERAALSLSRSDSGAAYGSHVNTMFTLEYIKHEVRHDTPYANVSSCCQRASMFCRPEACRAVQKEADRQREKFTAASRPPCCEQLLRQLSALCWRLIFDSGYDSVFAYTCQFVHTLRVEVFLSTLRFSEPISFAITLSPFLSYYFSSNSFIAPRTR